MDKENLLGVMQGRLLPKYQGRYQAHPLGYWQQEFTIAAQLGLDCIEFIVDLNDLQDNPLMSAPGRDEIRVLTLQTGVQVKTFCADIFMQQPLHDENSNKSGASLMVLQSLLVAAKELQVSDIVIPCVDQSSLASDKQMERFVQAIKPLLSECEHYGVNLSLETDLAPEPFVRLLDRLSSARVTVNYDIGNSAALGYDPKVELSHYGDRISDIHVKDRVLNGGPVVLGQGDADFERFFDALAAYRYKGPFIMQAYRDEQGVDIFKQQLDWVRPYLRSHGE
ncbi:sugar phosphate isomerase/epimerase family protein [Bowmanella denitrificans]